MADIEIVKGEFGDSYDITIYDEETGSPTDLDNFDTITMTVKTSDFATQKLQVNLSKPSGTTGVVRWVITSAHTSTLDAGYYNAQIDMVDSAISVRRKTKFMTMEVLEKFD